MVWVATSSERKARILQNPRLDRSLRICALCLEVKNNVSQLLVVLIVGRWFFGIEVAESNIGHFRQPLPGVY